MSGERIAIIVQARMTSSRLPGKVLKPVLGKPLLAYEIERLRRVRLATDLVVATTVNSEDYPVVALCGELGVPCYQGSEHDVLGRYYEAAKHVSADIVVRITADCPLIEPGLIDQSLALFLVEPRRFDYVSNTQRRCYPQGLDNEVFSFAALETAQRNAQLDYEREHVTPYIYQRPAQFRMGQVTDATDFSHHRWTVDTAEDFELISRILEALYPNKPDFTMQDVLNLLEAHPDWLSINASIRQKKLGQ